MSTAVVPRDMIKKFLKWGIAKMKKITQELEYLQEILKAGVENPLLKEQIKKGITNLKLIQKGILFCPHCNPKEIYDGSFQFLGYWIKMLLVEFETRTSMGTFSGNYWECPECCYKIEEEKKENEIFIL